jgi:phosphoglycerol transferase MdoB-like AlkP superfamily enzyme
LLNTVANYDNAVSKLINRFYDDKYASNNVLIITADHATFPSTLYKQTIDGNALYFVNKVPFIVYTYGIKPNVIDVHGMNSLSFAPTILHMLGITNGQNYFLGCSVFDKKCKSEFKCVTNIGSETYKTDNAEIKRSEDKLLEIKIKKFYNLSN